MYDIVKQNLFRYVKQEKERKNGKSHGNKGNSYP